MLFLVVSRSYIRNIKKFHSILQTHSVPFFVCTLKSRLLRLFFLYFFLFFIFFVRFLTFQAKRQQKVTNIHTWTYFLVYMCNRWVWDNRNALEKLNWLKSWWLYPKDEFLDINVNWSIIRSFCSNPKVRKVIFKIPLFYAKNAKKFYFCKKCFLSNKAQDKMPKSPSTFCKSQKMHQIYIPGPKQQHVFSWNCSLKR